MTISSVTRRFVPKLALKDFTAVLTPGVYGLLGPNGAGKTTQAISASYIKERVVTPSKHTIRVP